MAGESSQDRPRTVADHIVEHLETVAGVRHVFGVHGANIEDVYDAVARRDGALRAVIGKHEFSAGAMADGHFRAGGGLAAVAVTSGGGALNLVPALGEAYASGVPVIALIGQPPTALEGRGAFQDQSGLAGSLDGPALFAPVSRFCARVDKPDEIADLLPRAVEAALAGPGPAVLLLPKDVQSAPFSAEEAGPAPVEGASPAGPPDRRVIRVLGEASWTGIAPLIIAGAGVVRADARAELARFAEAAGALVAVEPDAKDAFDNRDPRFVGVAGANGHPSVPARLAETTVCVLVGTRFPQVARAGLEAELAGRTVVCLNPEPPYVDGGREVMAVVADLRLSLPSITERLTAEYGSPPVPEHPGLAYLPHERSEPGKMALREVVETLADAVPESAVVVSDAGNTGCGVLHFLPAPSQGRYLLALGMGGMGFSFGAGIGAALGTGRRTFVLAGDGSFFMHGMEVHTAVEHDLPITFVVFNNNGHAACASREELFYDHVGPYNRFRDSDIGGGVAALFPSIRARTVRGLDELAEFLAETAASRSPNLVSIEMRLDEMPPYLPFAGAARTGPTEGTP
ncbi:thiamine pyrophosphate-binding protein [Amycolatopsis nigrescens]|uniref:thiamine pyrophosphate-binding protein n=1 Tax=Amycolatopsis nigrescens TaxID=381445 RepID=UPI00037F4D3E|nr:thiamine pyrophosphate-binding protein [Amycolatopsis nigrescens]